MSTVISKNVQVGTSGTATNNFTWYQPAVPDGTVRLGVGNSGTTSADVVTANSSGNVGIGTSSPGSYFLSKAVTVVSDGSGIAISKPSSTANSYLYFGYDTTNAGQQQAAIGSISSSLAFFTATNERARIDSSGNLLVGTTTVAANAKMTVSFTGGSGSSRGLVMLSGSTASTAMIAFQNPNGYAQGEILTSGTTTSYNTSSDYRLKEAVQPMTGALAKVTALKPVTYKWKVDGSDGEGFIAHELQAVVPQCVSGEKDAVDAEGNPVYQGIDTSFLVATLTAAIQEQQAIIEQLKADVATLKGAQA